VWMEQPREFFITIIPPVWQRPWFIVLMSIIGVKMLAIVFYLYGKNQKAKLRKELEVQQKIELERLRISRDLHDNVGAQLSYLITNMEWLADHPEEFNKEKEREMLKRLSETGRQAILTLRQTIWAISQHELSVEEFADRFKQYALKMTDFNRHTKVLFEEHIENDSTLSPAVALNLFRICQEAFNNALKHSRATAITIQFMGNAQTKFQFIITDDGNGFDFENASSNGHYGLKNMQARASECHAQLDFNTSLGKGTTVTLTCEA
jgi:signal transduction histidine kinase